jgi:hypothetical protein
MYHLKISLLLEAYEKAIEMKLEKGFIEIIIVV